MDGRITKILAKSLDALEDRIEKGDTKVLSTKDGIFREQVPVSARDLAVVTGVLFDKRAAIRKTPESDDDHAESALERIANKLRQYSLAENKDVLRDTAVEDVKVIDDCEDLV
jgi:chromosome segregation and condensation protein ScpB